MNNLNSNIHFKINKKFTIKLIIILLLLIIFISVLITVISEMKYNSIYENSNAKILLDRDEDADRIGIKKDDMITNVFKRHNTSNFSISTWIYIQDWEYGNNKYKIILEQKDEDKTNMIIALDKNNNNLILGINMNDNGDKGLVMKYYVYENIQTQK